MKTKLGPLTFLMLFTLFAGAQPKSFTLYNQVRYNNSPKSLMPYLQPIKIANEKQLLNADNLPDQAAIESFARTCNPGELVTLDLETWSYYGSALTSTVNNLINSINYFKNANTTSPVSFYAVPPKQAYEWKSIDPVNNPSGYGNWRYINDQLAPVASKVDNFQPSFYTYDADTTSWRKMVDTTIAAIKRYSTSKPIYAYIWPQYHQGTDPLQLQFIDTAIWKYQLRTLYDRANGVIIWTSNKNPDGTFISWDPNMLWWQATKSFMVEKSLTKPFMLDSFSVNRVGTSENLYWSTSIDTTTVKFFVQRGTDGSNFTTVGSSITPASNHYTQNIYKMVDDNPAKVNLYYRLKMENKDGSVTYSPVVFSDAISPIAGKWNTPGGSWTYNFTSGTAGVYSETGKLNLSSAQNGFMPPTPSGTSMLFIASGGDANFKLDPPGNKLIYTSGSTANSKMTAYGIVGATPVAMMSLNISLDSTGKPANNFNYIWSIGNSTANGNIYKGSNSFYKSSTAFKSIFTGVRMLYNSTNASYTLSYRATTGNTNGAQFSTLSGGSIYGGIPYTMEVFCNNSTDFEDYTGPDGKTYSVAPASFHLWAINQKTETSVHFSLSVADGGGYNIPRSVETVTTEGDQSMVDNTPLDAFLIQGGSNTGLVGFATIDGPMYISYVNGGLPVTFLSSSFNGRYLDKSILLNWSTSSEQNNAFFEVQRSTDARTFTSIGKVAGHLTTNLQQNYSFIDNNPFSGVNYYKLKQVDMDGRIAFNSDIVAVNVPQQLNAFNAYVSGSQLKATAYSLNGDNAILKVYSVSGQQVSNTKIKLNQGINTFNVDLSSLQTGIYIAVLNRNGKEEMVKFLK